MDTISAITEIQDARNAVLCKDSFEEHMETAFGVLPNHVVHEVHLWDGVTSARRLSFVMSCDEQSLVTDVSDWLSPSLDEDWLAPPVFTHHTTD